MIVGKAVEGKTPARHPRHQPQTKKPIWEHRDIERVEALQVKSFYIPLTNASP